MNNRLKSFIEVLIIIVLFVFFSYIVQSNIDFFKGIIGDGFLGMFFYVLITIVAIVIAPISTMPLLPIASNLWGVFSAALLSIIGWTVGAFIAFIIARTYGVPIIKKFVPIEKINKLEKMVPRENVFWGVVFLRMIVPVDILSYALGLFSKMKTRDYVLATLIGVSPFAFVFAYLGKMPIQYQLAAFLVIAIILIIGFIVKEKRRKKRVLF